MKLAIVVLFVMSMALIEGARPNYRREYCQNEDYYPNQYFPRLSCGTDYITLEVNKSFKIKLVCNKGIKCAIVDRTLNDPVLYHNNYKIKDALDKFAYEECGIVVREKDGQGKCYTF